MAPKQVAFSLTPIAVKIAEWECHLEIGGIKKFSIPYDKLDKDNLIGNEIVKLYKKICQ